MYVLSHRGVRAPAIENTLPAFEAAVALGVDGIETDVHCTSDGALVLHHNRHVGGLAIESSTHAALNAAAGRVLPVVSDCLDTWPALIWNLELKSLSAAAPLLALLNRRDAARVVVSSFHHGAAVTFGHACECKTGVLVAHRPVPGGWPFDAWRRAGVDVIVAAFDALDEALVAAVRAAGFLLWTFGPVDAADHERCRAWALDAVITDDPTLALRA